MYELDTYACRFDAGPSLIHRFFEHPAGALQVTAVHQRRRQGAAQPLQESDGSEGIALVLVADLSCLGYRNRGASATNVMEDIVSRFGVLAARFQVPLNMLVWVELDSDGHFDMVYPSRGSCDFGPLRSLSGRVPARSMHAFEELFPVLGPAILDRLPAPTKEISSSAAGVTRPAWQHRQRG